MSSNYPAGSMRGSGIYTTDYEADFTCEADGCDYEGTATFISDDWDNVTAECPKCGEERDFGDANDNAEADLGDYLYDLSRE